jgi:uncharacterized protein (TIGR00661 family)
MNITMILQLPKFFLGVKKENNTLNEIIKDYKIDGIISDNRYGLYSNKIPSVFITHQLEIKTAYFTNNIRKLNYKYINKYNACWVVDDKEDNLAGELSRPTNLPKNTTYIGRQSRFKHQNLEKKYDFLAIVSGPEPQRTIFEKGIIKALQKRKEKSLIVLGKTELNDTKEIGALTIKSHLNAKDLNHAILQSDLIICRSGYSTIMDLEKLGKKAFLIPTPGQTEQEYLAKKLDKKNICYSQSQNKFDFEKAIIESKKFTGFLKSKKQSIDWEELFSLF